MPRKHARYRIRSAVGVLRDGRRDTAQLRDVSPDGACLDGVRDVLAGDHVRLHAKGALITGEVRWVRGQRCGICFAHDTPPSERTRFLAALGRSGTMPGARLHGFAEMA